MVGNAGGRDGDYWDAALATLEKRGDALTHADA